MSLSNPVLDTEVSRICADLDGEVETFQTRPLEHQGFPYVFLDATYCKATPTRWSAATSTARAPGCSPKPS